MTNLKRNLIYNMAYQILLIILPFITAPYVSRVLGVEGIGTYSYIHSIAYYFGLFGMLGISNHGNRSIALVKDDKEKMSKEFSNIYTIQFLFTTISSIAYIIFVCYIFEGNRTIALIEIIFIISYMLDISWFFFGLEKFKLTVTRNSIIKIITVLATFIFVKNKNDLWIYTLILSTGTLISQIYLWLYLKKYILLRKPNVKEMINHIRPIFVLFIPVIAFSIYKIMDKIMLGKMMSVNQVGLYENSEKIINIPLGIITAFGTVMMPRISSLIAEKNTERINQYTEISFKYFSILAFAMIGGLIGISKSFVPIYFGNEFIGCISIVCVLSFTLIFTTWANIIRTQYLIPNKKDYPYVISTIGGAIVNFVFNYIYIPKLGSVGAAIGTVIAEMVVFGIQAIYVRKELDVLLHTKNTLIFAVFSVIMAIIVYMLGNYLRVNIVVLILQVVVGVIVYVLMSFIYLIKSNDNFVIEVIKKIRRN